MRVPRWREEKWEEGGCPGCPAFSKKQKSKKDNQWKRGPSSAHRHLVVRPRQMVQLTGRGDKKRRGRERKRELLLLAVSIVRPRERVTTLHTLAHTRISRTHTHAHRQSVRSSGSLASSPLGLRSCLFEGYRRNMPNAAGTVGWLQKPR